MTPRQRRRTGPSFCLDVASTSLLARPDTKTPRLRSILRRMHGQTFLVMLPTVVSATLYAFVHGTFFVGMLGRGARRATSVFPWVSILKPIAGADEDLRQNLESFAALDYPAYELLFGLASPEDPAVPIVQRFLAEHPQMCARLVWTAPAGGAVYNPKVAQLLGLTRAARGSVLVVSDANVRVSPNYLRDLLALLLRPGVGLVSSLIVGSGERSFGAALEHAQLGAFVAPVVATAHRLGRPVTIGKSMAMRRIDLERVGGWESVAGVLAEDDVLGQRFHQLGYEVALCLEPVHNRNVMGSPLRSIERHARWARMRRGLAPRLFAGELLLSPLVVAAVLFLLAPTRLTFAGILTALALQCAGAWMSHALLGAHRPWMLAALEPVRVAAWLLCWCLALASRRVSWRGHAFFVGAGSRLMPVACTPMGRLRERFRAA